MRLAASIAVALPVIGAASAQGFPPPVMGVTVVKSKYDENVKITYKENDICETTEGVRSFTGHVHLPPDNDYFGVYQNYSINTFFWFFEAREDPKNAPLSIWLNGGPGSSSMIGLFQENGPCWINDDSKSTTNNSFSWNNRVNMLYIDQPNQVGFSYDELTNITYSTINDTISVADFSSGVPAQNLSTLVGTGSSQKPWATANNTVNAARSIWHFAQVWFQEFPEHKPNNNKISIWTESYGGRYGPSFASYFQEQNEKIKNHTITKEGEMHILNLDTLGVINGCIDLMFQAESYAEFPYNNTYGITAYTKEKRDAIIRDIHRPDGCFDKLAKCREAAKEGDPHFYSNNATVNAICAEANSDCDKYLMEPFQEANLGYYDIAHPLQDPFPPPFFKGFLSQSSVLSDMGSPVNFSHYSQAVGKSFHGVGDYARPDVRGFTGDIAYLLESGVKVALVYGDRDYICNWLGGEQVSLGLNYTGTEAFRKAGYADVKVNSSYVGGLVRQHGNFSFTRVFEAGHEVPGYQPETSLKIFERIMFNKDIATGELDIAQKQDYGTTGTESTFQVKNEIPPSPEPTCYLLSADGTCTPEQLNAIENGTAVVENYIIKSPAASKGNPPPTTTSSPTASPTAGSAMLKAPVAMLAISALTVLAFYL
ncbi:TPA_exp: Serine carboxypeptidase A [Trichophyton benhamiae CBS 112371]|uniref:Carboxypeptidase S1 homolog A n=1 Tax=Arthroderma benhamiae (strain ATCC MYA-4681 / CBS 112371) TaxID=663331 RepID=SCPA_ARTBC|nr:carboxypeptidase S1, putative [Trichophyton benhamiae CBS 112371]D4AIF1.1 RecName: Full=Carboxypeptidase S1 homolog A; AltName: Full=Serine carboxypeptidase A; Short=SCPA; Flags: Precursor [Trichophyton benhamiae CBS 112371]EFE36524.1 carboxypeptidase S1, putative [Trichophyton benhamiae CBS 112371]DAA79308.1 TPA_exp: Serine carboxypeptidase A [Trichophyton benhamiae CBS 112371]